jgi:hypothetical protein
MAANVDNDADEYRAQASAQALADARWRTAQPLLMISAVIIGILITAGIAIMIFVGRAQHQQ